MEARNNSHPDRVQAMRQETIRRYSILAVAVNMVLAVGKISAGAVFHALSVLGDGVNNLSDAMGSFAVLLFGRAAEKPGDEHHPYGHGRMEYLATLLVGILVLFMGVEVLRNSLDSVRNGNGPELNAGMAAVMAVSILVKMGLGAFAMAKGKKYRADILTAQARDSFLDVISTSAVLLGLFIARKTGWPLDGWLGIAVSVLIFIEGIQITRETIDSLIGREPDRETGARILQILRSTGGVISEHDLQLHDYGPGHIVGSVDIVVDGSRTLNELHPLADKVERRVMKELGIPLTVHLDPAQIDDPETGKLRKLVNEILSVFPSCRTHDLTVYESGGHRVLSFDLLIPHGFRETESVKRELVSRVEKESPGTECVIKVDVDYYS